jgi:hypothetical protein
MPIDPSIALSIRPPQVENPLQTIGQVASLRNIGQQSALQAEQLKAAHLENQQRDDQLSATHALNQAFTNATTVDPETQIPTIDHQKVIRSLSQSGQGSQIPAYMAHAADVRKKVADTAKTELENNKAQASFISQNMNAVNDLPTYLSAKASLKAAGIDTSKMAPDYDPAIVEQYKAKGKATSEYFGQQHQILDFLDRQEREKPKTLKEWSGLINQDTATVGSQGELDGSRVKWKAVGAPKELVDQIPAMWTPDIQQKLKDRALTENEREMRGQAADNALANRDLRQQGLQIRQDLLDLRREKQAGSGAPKPATPAQLTGIERIKQTGLMRAEQNYRRAIEKASAGGDIDPAAAADAAEQLRKEKQQAQDLFESSLGNYGVQPDHVEYSESGQPAKPGQLPRVQPGPGVASSSGPQSIPGQQATPAATSSAAPSPQKKGIATQADIAAYAKAHGLTEAQAKTQALKEGWRIQ